MIDATEARRVAAAVGETCGVDVEVRSFLGGQAQGAWEVRMRGGPRPEGVLKFSTVPGWVAQARRYKALSEHLRRRGHPAAEVLLEGDVADGYFLLFERLPGVRLDGGTDGPITCAQLEVLLPLTDRHAALAPRRDVGWSDYVWDVVFGERHEWSVLSASRDPAVVEFLASVRDRRAALADAVPTRDDFVIGSLTPANVLVEGATITGVCDLEAGGPGDRVVDLACALVLCAGIDEEAMVREAAGRIGRTDSLDVAELYWSINSMCGALATGDAVAVERCAADVSARLDRQKRWSAG